MLRQLLRLNGYHALSREEKGTLLDLMCHLEAYGGTTFLDKGLKVPMTDDQIAEMLGVVVGAWRDLKERLLKAKILKPHGQGAILPLMASAEACKLPSEELELARNVLAMWNEKKIMVHKETDSLIAKISKLLKKHSYTMEQLKDSVENYSKVLADPDCFWTRKWSLADFLSRGVDRFVSDADPLNAFRSLKADKKQGGRQSILTVKRSEEYDFEGL